MKEFEGTPGPWIVDKDFDVTTNGGCVVAWTAVGVFSQEERVSNAHLISASPELLSALQNIVNYHFGKTATAPAYLEAKAAIAKALGESQ